MMTPTPQPAPETIVQQSIPQEAFDWYDEYAHGIIDRRTFMSRLTTLAAAGFSMNILLSTLMPNYVNAEQVSFNAPEIKARYSTFPSPDGHGEGRGYLVVPTALQGKGPVVLVVHENRGLNPYIKDVARRLAKAGFVAFAPDALHPLGGYPGNDDTGRSMQGSMDRSRMEQDFMAAAKFLTMHLYPACNHGFHNDSTGRFDEENARLAWDRTVAFFKEHLASAAGATRPRE